MAGGHDFSTGGGLTERWNGSTWSLLPELTPTIKPFLYGMACASTSNCVAVGTTYNPNETAVIYAWNGASWSRAKSPVIAGELFGVSCIASSCTTSGYQDTGSVFDTLVEQYP
jgi:hypothetical protein